jgi:hypothetical protein
MYPPQGLRIFSDVLIAMCFSEYLVILQAGFQDEKASAREKQVRFFGTLQIAGAGAWALLTLAAGWWCGTGGRGSAVTNFRD